MVQLENDLDPIRDFIQGAVDRFRNEHGTPTVVGIYCCPWAGWLSVNFNLDQQLNVTGSNCPDLQYVEYDLFEIPSWQEEYESDEASFSLHGEITVMDPDQGDEQLNELIFKFLKELINGIKPEQSPVFFLQLLDSRFAEQV